MSESRFGRQPAADLLADQRWSVPVCAGQIAVPVNQLRGAILGRIRPSPAVRKRLPVLLGVTLEECFTQDSLEKSFVARKMAGRPVWSEGHAERLARSILTSTNHELDQAIGHALITAGSQTRQIAVIRALVESSR